MIRKLIKKIPGTKSLNKILLERNIMKNFLACSSLEFEKIKFYEQFIKKNDLIFDVGANVGSKSKLFLNLGGKVVGFEPQNELCNYLNDHLKRNKKFNLERTALGSELGFAERSRIEKILAKKKGAIKKIARKLLPKMIRKEKEKRVKKAQEKT